MEIRKLVKIVQETLIDNEKNHEDIEKINEKLANSQWIADKQRFHFTNNSNANNNNPAGEENLI